MRPLLLIAGLVIGAGIVVSLSGSDWRDSDADHMDSANRSAEDNTTSSEFGYHVLRLPHNASMGWMPNLTESDVANVTLLGDAIARAALLGPNEHVKVPVQEDNLGELYELSNFLIRNVCVRDPEPRCGGGAWQYDGMKVFLTVDLESNGGEAGDIDTSYLQD